MKYDIVEDNIKIGNKIIYVIDKDILDIIHSLEKENQELKKIVELYSKSLYNAELTKCKEVIDRIINETKETRNIINNNRDDNVLSKGCLLSYLEIIEDLLKEVSE